MVAPGLESKRQPDFFGDDLLLEQRRKYQGSDPGIGQRLSPLDVSSQRPGRSHDG